MDTLSQGTGIGLYLSYNLAELLGGELRLDADYDSGFQGNVGTRFVVDLCTEPIEHELKHLDEAGSGSKVTAETMETSDTALLLDERDLTLPENLNVLFVDDDPILRKLFARTIRTVAPGWSIREAANGETAIRLTKEQHFDLIFCDMYMPSVLEKPLLGTETVKTLRASGINCRICGLSANDKEAEFLEAGADVFIFKPIPCDPPCLRQELQRILFQEPQTAPCDVRAVD